MTPPDLVDQIHDEIDEEAPPSAVVLLPASVPLTVAAASVVNIVAGDNEIGEEAADEHETDEEVGDDNSDKDLAIKMQFSRLLISAITRFSSKSNGLSHTRNKISDHGGSPETMLS
ncbi:hypothetical protein Bca101_070231 [Brassica carinata]